jgi:HEAT repeat protein
VQGDGAKLPAAAQRDVVEAVLRGDSVALEAASHDAEPRRRVLAVRGWQRLGQLHGERAKTFLRDPDADVVREVLLQLPTTIDHDLVLEVRSALRHEDPLVAEAAALRLGEWGEIESLDQLIDVAQHHEDARVRESAVVALGMIGDERGLPTVIGALDDKPPVRRRAVVALSNFEGPDVEAALTRAAEDRDWQVRAAVERLRS